MPEQDSGQAQGRPGSRRRGIPQWAQAVAGDVVATFDQVVGNMYGYEMRYAPPDKRREESDHIWIAPATARIRSADRHDGAEAMVGIHTIALVALTECFRPGEFGLHVDWDEGREDEGARINVTGRARGHEIEVTIYMDEPFDDAEPRTLVHDMPGEPFGFERLDDADEPDE